MDQLEEGMMASPYPALWEEVCFITDHCLHLHKVAVKSQDLLDTPLTPQGLFGLVIASMQKEGG